jgi:hypothetical protein
LQELSEVGVNYQLFFVILLNVFYSCGAVAKDEGIGGVANDIFEPVYLVIQLVRSVSIVCGSGLILGGFLKFIEYRRNPVAVRLSTVVSMFFFGIALILIGFIPMKITS